MSLVYLKVIGCGDAFGSGGRLNTCFYVKTETSKFLIDCGASSLPGLKHHGININDIDAIVISHFHGDHYGGVPFLLLDAAIHGRKKKMQIISPPGGKDRISALLDLLYPGTSVLEKLNVDFLEYAADKVLKLEHFNLRALPVIHSEKALPHGIRIEISDKVIAYSGDTSWTNTLLALSDKADVFICECNFFGTQAKGHMNYLELEMRLPEFSCKRMLLTHFDQEMLEKLDQLKVGYLSDGFALMV
ncbi:MBL fold metallo-hydrolase [Pedobacter hiemivivus]|uniref:MBL fold metallo-hydrolase n=1 Tax=Pedobacter hiemivivus TaxID=2530454 RepID=A0A4R0MVS5_9SPHI|nr:MBL fold metallo-hydrolase [Pedobacter hiemivivus]TCC90973.1 MBL fold metallo-hydrolase [Pedobacter hiemivivus]